MGAKTVTGQIAGQAYSNVSIGSYSASDAAYAGYNGELYFGCAMKFTAPAFEGVSKSLAVSLWIYKGVGTTSTLRYALLSSDANKNSYVGTSGAVTDANQIATGTVTFEGLTSETAQQSFTISTAALKKNTTYYLILWASENTGITIQPVSSAWGDNTVTLSYISGIALIRAAGGDVNGIPEIYHNGAWVTPIQDIYHDGQWVTPS